MLSVKPCPLPANSLLQEYAQQGAYTDCYMTTITGEVSHAAFVSAFYTTPLFKVERLILKWLLSKPSSDDQAKRLAKGETNLFAAWVVEDYCENQLLLSDYKHVTRSWLMVEPIANDTKQATRLYFGSAITTHHHSNNAKESMSYGLSLLISFHKIYSVLLLVSAKIRLKHQNS